MRVLSELPLSSGIGTLSEKSAHKMIKLFLEPDESYHEVEFLGSVADVKREGQMYEIQTHSAERLIPKLEKFLAEASVCVTLPVIVKKTVRRLDKESGEISDPKVSPKHESIYTAMGEIYKLRRFICSQGFSVKLLFLEAEEYRYTSARRGKRKIDTIPTALLSTLDLASAADYFSIIKNPPCAPFTAQVLAKGEGCPRALSSAFAGVLYSAGVIERVGKERNAYTYEMKK